MTTATDMGFEIGKLYRVINSDDSSYYNKGMIVKFVLDDNSSCPRFELVTGKPNRTMLDGRYYIELCNLEPVEAMEVSTIGMYKPLLLLYIQQQYPNDKVLRALVESL